MSRYSFDPMTPGGQRPAGYWSDRVWGDMWNDQRLRRKMELAKQARAQGRYIPRRFGDVIATPP